MATDRNPNTGGNNLLGGKSGKTRAFQKGLLTKGREKEREGGTGEKSAAKIWEGIARKSKKKKKVK